MKANGIAGATRRISETAGDSVQSYERRMRVFNLGVIVVALIVLTILIVWLSTAWMAFEKSLGLTFSDTRVTFWETGPQMLKQQEAEYLKVQQQPNEYRD
jgi:hypothetical protein